MLLSAENSSGHRAPTPILPEADSDASANRRYRKRTGRHETSPSDHHDDLHAPLFLRTPSPPAPRLISERDPPSGRWEVWIDTGGTFTDCLARDPEDRLHRVKVLSSSAVRGTIIRASSDGALCVEARWGGVGSVVHGFRFRPLGAQSPVAAVETYDPESGLLRLDRVPRGLTPGLGFDLLSPEESPILAARIVTGTGAGERLPPMKMRLATTRGTNALLERRGAPVALFVDRGFGDLLEIGTQQRPDLFALRIDRAPPITRTVVEVYGRLASDGSVLEPLDEDRLRRGALEALEAGASVAAIALMHSYRNPEHEIRVEEMLRALGFREISRSSLLAPSIGLLHRAQTTAVDAYLSPILSRYLRSVESALLASDGGTEMNRLHVMTSAGGLVGPRQFRAKDSLLSGPAGGAVGAAAAAARSGFSKILAFDMGGTSTDVSRYDGDFEYLWRHRVGDADLVAPALAIESVAAGGGSICTIDGQGLRVGPESAGAEPGPACYGAGGPLTITDCNLLLGRLDAARFGFPVSAAAATMALDLLRQRLLADTGEAPEAERLLTGLLEIANERMADAIRSVSLRQGHDPAEFALLVYGGAGAQHGCGVADRLGIQTQIIPPEAGLLSAWGLGRALLERVAERQLLEPLSEDRVRTALETLTATATRDLLDEGVPEDAVRVRRRIADVRYRGQENTLSIEVKEDSLREAFERRHEAVFGHRSTDREIELESLRVIASTRADPEAPLPDAPVAATQPDRLASTWISGGWREIAVYYRESLRAGNVFDGPCIVLDPYSSIVVEAAWCGRVDSAGAIILTRRPPHEVESGAPLEAADDRRPEAVREQLFTCRFEALVTEMGEQLRRTAVSPNVKERLDFSCALLDREGELVANAPHIPVHLGALGLCVRSLQAHLPMLPGDVVVTNHPAFGGSHLPDVTVVTPVFESGECLGYVASRAHHAEIGGTRPGSMPPGARSLAEEGVVIPPIYLVRGDVPVWEPVEALLASGDHPSRAPSDNLADLRAQVAANRRGADLLRSLAAAHGAPALRHFMSALTRRAERLASRALERFPPGEYRAEESLDDGSRLRVSIVIGGGRALFDFTGTSGVHPGNLNATPAIVRSALLYVLRLTIDEPLPLNEGLLRPVEVRLPRCMLNPSFSEDSHSSPAVAGGNTEVSQRLVDTVIKALGLAACSQGTMNNLLWGSDSYGYYETVCGGAGAGDGFPGSSAVHTHMTNTRITDAEILEHRYPVRVEKFSIRHGSGGAGRWPGGDGAIREITFLEPVSLSVLTQHRTVRPFGREGGEPGAAGSQWVVRADGSRIELASIDSCELHRDDRLVVETPGGGGWGKRS